MNNQSRYTELANAVGTIIKTTTVGPQRLRSINPIVERVALVLVSSFGSLPQRFRQTASPRMHARVSRAWHARRVAPTRLSLHVAHSPGALAARSHEQAVPNVLYILT